MKHIFRISIIAIGCLIYSNSYGQSIITKPYFLPNVFPDAPNSATLGRFGNYPVSYYSGVPEISIPIYEIKVGDISVPISLNYHASGIKVTDVASYSGLGWALQAGGQISRRIMGGKADEVLNGYLSGRTRLAGDINTSIDADYDYLKNILNNEYDVEPDILSYSFMGKNGKFFFNRLDGYKPALLPFAPIKINKTLINNKLSFDITDEHANRFFFGKLFYEQTDSYFGGVASYAINTWKLENIISANKKDTVSFNYISQYTDSGKDEVDMWVVEDQVNKFNNDCTYLPNYTSSITGSLTSSTTTELINSQIKFKTGKVEFQLSQQDRQDNRQGVKSLESIKIYSYDNLNKTYTLLKSVTLFQSYFINGTDITTKRLRLDSLQISDQKGMKIETYRFDYNTAIGLPPSHSKSKDYWGYYNGRTNTSLIPGQTITYSPSVGGSDVHIGSSNDLGREPDDSFMQAWILKRIYYPTGGHTDFEYETNKYKQADSEIIKLAGGLRAKSIKSYDGLNASPVIKTYRYGSAANGGAEVGHGRANFNLGSYYFHTTQTYRNYFAVSGGVTWVGSKKVRTYLSNPTIDVEPYDGTPVTYSIVTEYEGDEVQNSGKTVYYFKDVGDVPSPATMAKPVITSYFYLRGQLEKKIVYKNSNGVYQLVQQEVNTYTAFPRKVYTDIGLVVNKHTMNDGAVSGFIYPTSNVTPNDQYSWSTANYYIDSDDNYLTSTNTFLYDPVDTSKYVSTSTNIQYNNITHQQPSNIQTIDSRGVVHNKVNKFPADYLDASGTTTNNQLLDTMILQNKQAVLLESWDKIGATDTVVGAELNLYKQLSTGAIVISQQKKLDLLSPASNFSPATYSNNLITEDSRYKNRVTFDSYDSSPNLLQYSAASNPPVSVYWDKTGTNPIAKVSNSTYVLQNTTEVKEFYFQNFEEDLLASSARAHTGERSNYNREFNVNFTKPNTRKYLLSWFEWNGSIWVFNQEVYTGSKTFSSTVYVDDIRIFPEDAQMTTYTYKPLVGMTSQTDARGQTTYYEYDSFQRLSLIRDQYKNIVKTYCYNFAGQQSDCTTATNPNPVTACSPTSTLPCNGIELSLPVNLSFDQAQANTLIDINNQGLGFTMVDAYSGSRLSVDGTSSNSDVPGYEASQLTLGSGHLQILSNKGIAYLTNNNQLNALGVKFSSLDKYQVETVLINPFNGVSAQQAGIWIGQNDQTFLKLVVVGNKLEFRKEVNDVSVTADQLVTGVISGLDAQTVRLRIVVDPATSKASAFYSTDGVNYINVGAADFSITGMALTGSTVFAGIYATHRSSSTPVTYTFDNFSISVPPLN